AKISSMRCEAHTFLTACDDDVTVPISDRLRRHRNRPEPRAADEVNGHRRGFDRQRRQNRSLAGWILPLCGCGDLAEEDLGDFAGLGVCALERLGDNGLAEFVCGNARQRSIERADRRTCGASDDDGFLAVHEYLPSRIRGGSVAALLSNRNG